MADHEHEHDDDSTFGIALGFRILDEEGELYLVEAEIAPYVNEPTELGVTLVFHPLSGLDPAADSEELDWPAWPVDIDDDLERIETDPVATQFQSIVRQLHNLSTDRLLRYLRTAREESDTE